jgi:hypothetical protein
MCLVLPQECEVARLTVKKKNCVNLFWVFVWLVLCNQHGVAKMGVYKWTEYWYLPKKFA